jgi:hypothetical protein
MRQRQITLAEPPCIALFGLGGATALRVTDVSRAFPNTLQRFWYCSGLERTETCGTAKESRHLGRSAAI